MVHCFQMMAYFEPRYSHTVVNACLRRYNIYFGLVMTLTFDLL